MEAGKIVGKDTKTQARASEIGKFEISSFLVSAIAYWALFPIFAVHFKKGVSWPI
jgi:hypothetical protein